MVIVTSQVHVHDGVSFIQYITRSLKMRKENRLGIMVDLNIKGEISF